MLELHASNLLVASQADPDTAAQAAQWAMAPGGLYRLRVLRGSCLHDQRDWAGSWADFDSAVELRAGQPDIGPMAEPYHGRGRAGLRQGLAELLREGPPTAAPARALRWLTDAATDLQHAQAAAADDGAAGRHHDCVVLLAEAEAQLLLVRLARPVACLSKLANSVHFAMAGGGR